MQVGGWDGGLGPRAERRGLVWALNASKGEAGLGVGGVAPASGGKSLDRFHHVQPLAVPLDVPCPKPESARNINA